jgi:hypothetical protein
MKIIMTTTSIRTKLAMIDMIGPRLTDPKAKMEEFLGLFRYADEKSKVEDVLKARSATLMSSVFRATPASRNNSVTGPRQGKGRGGLGMGRRSRRMNSTDSSGSYDFSEEASRSDSVATTTDAIHEYNAQYSAQEEAATLDSSKSLSQDSSSSSTQLNGAESPRTDSESPTPAPAPSLAILSPRTSTRISTPIVSDSATTIKPSFNNVTKLETIPETPQTDDPLNSGRATTSEKADDSKTASARIAKSTKMASALDKMSNAISKLTPRSDDDSAPSSPHPAGMNGKQVRPQSLITMPVNSQMRRTNSDQTIRMVPVCPGLVVKIRPNASAANPHVGLIRSGQEIEVFTQRENGFYKLVDGRVSYLINPKNLLSYNS